MGLLILPLLLPGNDLLRGDTSSPFPPMSMIGICPTAAHPVGSWFIYIFSMTDLRGVYSPASSWSLSRLHGLGWHLCHCLPRGGRENRREYEREILVPKGGVEPPRVTPHAPQACASTSSATSARFSF